MLLIFIVIVDISRYSRGVRATMADRSFVCIDMRIDISVDMRIDMRTATRTVICQALFHGIGRERSRRDEYKVPGRPT